MSTEHLCPDCGLRMVWNTQYMIWECPPCNLISDLDTEQDADVDMDLEYEKHYEYTHQFPK